VTDLLLVTPSKKTNWWLTQLILNGKEWNTILSFTEGEITKLYVLFTKLIYGEAFFSISIIYYEFYIDPELVDGLLTKTFKRIANNWFWTCWHLMTTTNERNIYMNKVKLNNNSNLLFQVYIEMKIHTGFHVKAGHKKEDFTSDSSRKIESCVMVFLFALLTFTH